MAEFERLTVTLLAEMATVVRRAVASVDHASTSEIVRAAFRDWKTKRSLQIGELDALRTEIGSGLADAAAGRTTDFDIGRIIEKGRTRFSARSSSL